MLRRTSAVLAAVAALGASAPPASAQARPQAESRGALVLQDVTVVDVVAGTTVPHRRVVLRGDTIAAVEPAEAPPVPDEELRLDGAGLYVIPGLVDHHVHLGPGSEDDLRRALRGGVTMVQAMAGDTRLDGDLSREVLAGELEGPDVYYAAFMAGPAFHEDPRVQGASLGYARGTAPWMQAVTDTTDPVVAVAEAKGTGASVLKLYAMMDAGLAERLTAEGHRLGMTVVAHGTVFPARPSELVAAGVDVLTHAAYLSWEGAPTVRAEDAWDRKKGPYGTVPPDSPAITDVLEAMAARGTYLEPTLWVFQQGEDVDSTLVRWSQAVTREADALGVPILAGTDGLIGRGPRALPNIHGEMAALVRAGLTPARALAAATITDARSMKLAGSHGSVAPGKVADLVLLTDDPLEDIAATTHIRYVVRRGRLLDVRR